MPEASACHTGPTGAHWLLLGPDALFVHTPYDLEAAAKRVRASGYPDAEEFGERSVLKPASEEETTPGFK